MLSPARRLRPICLLLAPLFLVSCATEPSKEASGTALGALAGALLGSAVSNKDDRAKGVLIGAIAGAYIGNRIGNYLDEQDRQRLAMSTQQTIATGQPQSWTNKQTGVSAKTSVASANVEQKSINIKVLKDRVQEVPPLELLGESRLVNKTANVRGGPGTDYVVVDSLPAGQNVMVVGKVEDGDWYMISQGGAASGFVHASLIASKPAPSPAVPSAAPAGAVEDTVVNASRTCRVVVQEVQLKDGRTVNEEVRACQGPNGWEIV